MSVTATDLTDDVIGEIMMFCDFTTAENFAIFLSSFPDSRRLPEDWNHVWRLMFVRQGFCDPINETERISTLDYLRLFKRHQALLNRLGDASGNPSRPCLARGSLRFSPMVPIPSTIEELDVFFSSYDRENFVLTSPGTSPELLLQDPLDLSLRVYDLDSFRQEDIHTHSQRDADQTSAAAPNESRSPLPGLESKRLSFATAHDDENDDTTWSYSRVEAQPIGHRHEIAGFWKVQGTMVCIGRSLCRKNTGAFAGLVELFCWIQDGPQSSYSRKWLCRFSQNILLWETDPSKKLLFVQHAAGVGQHKSRAIHIYPLVAWQHDDNPANRCLSFPVAYSIVNCFGPVETISLDHVDRRMFVHTTKGGIEVWDVSCPLHPIQLSIIPNECFSASSPTGATVTSDNFVLATDGGVSKPFEFPRRSIFLPPHLPVSSFGFVALSPHSLDSRASLHLWKPNHFSGSWEICWKLPLHRFHGSIPRIHYDGNRLVLVGRDGAGYVVLVYLVSHRESPVSFSNIHTPIGCSSGSLLHKMLSKMTSLTPRTSVRLVREFRHVALNCDFDGYPWHFSCNERFLVFRTETGNQLGTSSCPSGLLIMDLEKQDTSDVLPSL